MDVLSLKGTKVLPSVYFDAQKGFLELKGKSIPADAMDFYIPLINWIDEYSKNPVIPTVVDVKLEYFNTNSSKCLLEFFRRLEVMHERGKTVIINWYSEKEDEDLEEAGEEFNVLIKIPFNKIIQ